jgi:dihydropyrimidine dehydrogenase (NAD+) subunit PreT
MPALPILPEGRLEQRFAESKPPFDAAEAVTEANRCLYCVDAPCVKACPTGIDIPTFIHKIATGNVKGAARTILAENLLGHSCAHVCPVEVLCAGGCVYNAWERAPIQIGRLQRFATGSALAESPLSKLVAPKKASTGRSVAFIGAGPASIAAAGWLALEGHTAVIYDRKSVPGGLNTLGIAPYKMLGEVAIDEVAQVAALGDVRFEFGVELDDAAAKGLLAKHDAVFLGLGLGADTRLGVPGEDGEGVYGGVDLVERIKSQAGFTLEGVRTALVVGGGNTAIDVAHELALLGVADVAMVYRRGRTAMTGYAHELDHARKHAVRLVENAVVTRYERDAAGRLKGVQLADAKDGRALAGTERFVACDLVALAIGQGRTTALAKAFDGVEVDSKGRVVVDPATHRTGHARVWSGGDCVNGGKEVVNAVQEGKLAARDIARVLAGA